MLGTMAVTTLTTIALLLTQPQLWNAYDQCTDQVMSEIWAALPECDPRDTLVPVIPPADPNILQVIPSQVLVARCAGTCHLQGSSRYHRCVPSNTYNTTLKVLYEKIVLEAGSAPSVVEVCGEVQVETHSSCLCGCEETNCTAAQVYDQRTCSCRCSNHGARGQCLVQHNKVWDESRCSCRCRPEELKECSTGFSYDPMYTCTCLPGPPLTASIEVVTALGALVLILFMATVALAMALLRLRRQLARLTMEMRPEAIPLNGQAHIAMEQQVPHLQ